MFLSLHPRFFEKIFWRLKKGKKATDIKEYFYYLYSHFLKQKFFYNNEGLFAKFSN
jgi:hypothetical protein